jgi:hypothetical protein
MEATSLQKPRDISATSGCNIAEDLVKTFFYPMMPLLFGFFEIFISYFISG